jgi:superfamily II DNA or RNA helicase
VTERAYQTECALKALKYDGFGLFLDMGLGKTYITIDIFRRRFLRGQASRFLVICPLRVKEQWREQIQRWWPEARVIEQPNDPGVPVWFITHYEWARENYKTLRTRGKFHGIAVDEGHKLRRRSSKQSRRIALLGNSIPYKLILTGTPVEHGPLDYWAYFRYLDPKVFGSSWSVFADGPVLEKTGRRVVHDDDKAWCTRTGYLNTKHELKPERLRGFMDLVAERSYTIKKEDALDLPPINLINIPIELYGKQKRAYEQMERDFVVRLPGIEQSAELVVTQMVRLQQIAGGFLKDDDGVVHRVGSLKLDYMMDLFEDHKEPLVVFARYHTEIDALAKLARGAGRSVTLITGKHKGDDRQFDVAIVQYSVTAGIDWLKRASTGVMYSKTFSRLEYEQARDRLHRDGQIRNVTVVSLITQSSIDDDLEEALQHKGDMIAGLLNLIRRRQNMAKTPVKSKATENKADASPAKADKPTFGIQQLAEELDKEQTIVRVGLRSLGVQKNGGRYGWEKKGDFDAVVKDLRKHFEKEPKKAKTAKEAA